MESLTPDRDELSERPEGPRRKKTGGGSSGGNDSGRGRRGQGGGGGRRGQGDGDNRRIQGLLLVLVIVVAISGGWSLWQQHQSIQSLSRELQQAQRWISETSLRSARLEGDLAQADQQLSKTGSEVEKQLASLDSEMRKLWAVAHQTNRPAIAENSKALQALGENLKATDEKAEAARTRAGEAMAASDNQGKKMQALRSQLEQVVTQRESLAAELETLRQAQAGMGKSLQESLARAGREQSLALEELRARLARVERDLDSAAGGADDEEVAALSARLDALEPVVVSVDNARSHLTRRYTELYERVNRLARQVDESSN